VIIVPEAASILWTGGFPRRPGDRNQQHKQKAIYYVQRELEGIIVDEFPQKLMICDRGSLDGMAYWPSDGSDFLKSVQTTVEAEIARYDFVIHLDTAPESNYDITNPLRTESYSEAWALNEKVKAAWATHPHRFIMPNLGGHFIDKLGRALTVVQEILKGRNYEQILESLEELER
jgi:hypothetical protein